MNAPFRFVDTLANLMSGLGLAGRDKAVSTQYVVTEIPEVQLVAAYRSDWIARKAIDIPAYDATREWRAWKADQDQIEALEETEKVFDIVRKLFLSISRGRLFGGAAMILGVEDGPADTPLDLEKVKKGSLKFIHVVSKNELTCGPLITNLLDPYYGRPEYFERAPRAGDISRPDRRIHPSRVIIFNGADRPDAVDQNTVWGDSIIQSIDDAVKNVGTVSGSLTQLITEAKTDIIRIPNLTEMVSTQAGQDKITKRFQYANVAKSIINTLLLDKEEEWQRLEVHFTGMPELLQIYLMIAAAAVDIPATRFLSQDPKGLNATGEGDLRNYYDRVKSDQKLKLTPNIMMLDEVIIRTTFGDRDPDIYYEWNPLWQMDDIQKATVAKNKAEVAKIDNDLGLIPITALVKVRQNQLIEDGFYPGLERALEEAEAEGDEPPALDEPDDVPIDPKTGLPLVPKPGPVPPGPRPPSPPPPPPLENE